MSGKKQLEFSKRAIHDVAGIEAYIMADNPGAAGRVVASIFSTAKQLKEQPLMGRKGREGTREQIPVHPDLSALLYQSPHPDRDAPLQAIPVTRGRVGPQRLSSFTNLQ